MRNYTKPSIKIEGKMSRKGADMTAKIDAISNLIFRLGVAVGAVLYGISNLLQVL